MENLTREQAIARYERVRGDAKLYPPMQTPAPEKEPGSFAEVLNTVRTANGEEPTDSVVDAVNGVSAADRRETRRPRQT